MQDRPTSLAQALVAIAPQRLRDMRRGVEKESLRCRPDGTLALTPHPEALGSALTHPHITTDFCESQLELITGVHSTVEACLAELTWIHQCVVQALGDELLWAASMPCGLPTDETIPLARYGTSNTGRLKSVYRMGLGHRYGRRMQTISGIHYNWSMPGLSNDDYLGLIRNFRRHSFLLLWLFGASPAVCESFVAGREHALQDLGNFAMGLPHATSLRMGRLGYQSDAQATLAVSYNSLQGYADTLLGALSQSYPAYEALGVRGPGGEYTQLSTTLLQIENEFYSTIRPKRAVRRGQRPLRALLDHGIEYVEVRCMDLNPFAPVGLDGRTMHFLDVFLLHCLLTPSPPDTPAEIAANARNQERTAARGREPGLTLEQTDGTSIPLVDWAARLLNECAPLADALDAAQGSTAHQAALRAAQQALQLPGLLPSARIMAHLQDSPDTGHLGLMRAQSAAAKLHLLGLPWTTTDQARGTAQAEASVRAQREIERADTETFEQYRLRYLQGLERGQHE